MSIPTEGRAGNWVLAAGSDVQRIVAGPDGALYAYGKGLTYTLYKSTNGGYGWSYLGNVRDSIVDIAASPHDAGWVYYATRSSAYRSNDGGRTFVQLPASPGGAGSNNVEITSLAVAWATSNVVGVGTRDTDASQPGGVYTLSEAEVLSGWVDTGLGSYDVYALAFSPNYAGDRQLVAVTSNETDTYVMSKSGYAAWGATTSNARLSQDNSAPTVPVTVSSAAIAFPGDYDSTTNSVVYVAIDSGAGSGDVYRINGSPAPGNSSATDLNIGSAYGLRNVAVTGLAATGSAVSTKLMAGATASAQTYFSSDGGKNWTKSSKEPTGASKTYVLMKDSKIYAATSGAESALSTSLDNGTTWNQVSLIDTSISTIVDFAPSPAHARENTLFLLTFGGKHSLWRSLNDGASWERVFSSVLSGVDSVSGVKLPPSYGNGSRTVFTSGTSGGRPGIWQSTDNGQKFNWRPAFDPASGTPLPIDAWAVSDDRSLVIASYDGSNGLIYGTSNSGFFYATGAAAGTVPLSAVALSPGYSKDGAILVGNTNGGVYWSGDNGTSFEPLPPGGGSTPLTGIISVAFDSGFGKNRTVYAASSTANKGVYRFVIGKSAQWESIDSTLPGGGMLNQLLVSSEGLLYAANSKAGGGMERALDPTYPLGPVFDTVMSGLNTNSTLFSLWQSGQRVWSADTATTRLMVYYDTLTLAAPSVSPPDGATGTGSLVNHTIKNVSLDWEALKGATSYQWQLSYNTNFSTVPAGFEGTTEASEAHLLTLEPGTRYQWRVRASAPVLSPWSPTRSFTTSLDTEVVPLTLESPKAGASGVPVKPLFQWGAVAGADAYELVVSTDARFASPLIARTGDTALPATAWQCDQGLKSDTTYYWRVRAINSSTASAWSPAGMFTTASLLAAAPPTSTPTATPLPPPPPSPTAKSQSAVPAPAALAPLATSVAPAPQAQSSPQAQPNAPLPPILNWIIYLLGALLLAIILLLVIILVMVTRMKKVF